MSGPRIDWSGLRTAGGTADGIPAALDALRSPDRKARQAAYWKIDNHAVLQGDLHEAAPFVVMALLSSLRTAPAGNEEIYDLLVEFANGYAPEDQVTTVHGSRESLLAATRGELAKGMALYWRDLRDPARGTRKGVAHLLLALSDDVEIDAAQLRSAFDAEADKDVNEVLGELLRQADP